MGLMIRSGTINGQDIVKRLQRYLVLPHTWSTLSTFVQFGDTESLWSI